MDKMYFAAAENNKEQEPGFAVLTTMSRTATVTPKDVVTTLHGPTGENVLLHVVLGSRSEPSTTATEMLSK